MKPVKPEVGMAATFGCWTDLYPGTVVSVTPSGKTIEIVQDIATRLDSNGMSESQEYAYAPNPTGRKLKFRLTTRKGETAWRCGPYVAVLGHRRAYHDYSF